MKKVALLVVAGFAVLVLSSNVGQSTTRPQAINLGPFFSKPDVTIAVTDSGLGGLAIMAEAAARLAEVRIFESVSFVFFNALFSNDSGYNSLKTREEKIAVFNSALESLARKYRPDVILIGCNTLSVLVEETPFFKAAKIPVFGIVGPGVSLIADELKLHPGSAVILFGTETTIGEGEHKKRLLEKGVQEEQIITQACPELASYIEKGYKSDDTGLLIESYVDEALAKRKNPVAPVLASLACTHYGYSVDIWNKVFEARRVKSFAILNPNSKMAEILISTKLKNRFAATAIRAQVVSMVEISRQKTDSLSEWLRKVSPETAAALVKYELKPELFEWKKFIKE